MRINDIHPPNRNEGPGGPGGEPPVGAVGGRSGRVVEPGPPRLPAESPDSAAPPLQQRVPLHAVLMDRCAAGEPAPEDVEKLEAWLSRSNANVERYADYMLMSALLKELTGDGKDRKTEPPRG